MSSWGLGYSPSELDLATGKVIPKELNIRTGTVSKGTTQKAEQALSGVKKPTTPTKKLNTPPQGSWL